MEDQPPQPNFTDLLRHFRIEVVLSSSITNGTTEGIFVVGVAYSPKPPSTWAWMRFYEENSHCEQLFPKTLPRTHSAHALLHTHTICRSVRAPYDCFLSDVGVPIDYVLAVCELDVFVDDEATVHLPEVQQRKPRRHRCFSPAQNTVINWFMEKRNF